MPITLNELSAAAYEVRTRVAKSLTEAKALGQRTAFLCHSHLDNTLAEGLESILRRQGWSVYIDWKDATMPDTPNRETATRIQTQIVACEYFLFLATGNSMKSRWCPWEIGFADGKKPTERILIVPTTDGSTAHGNEYLELYRSIDWATDRTLRAWGAGATTGGVLVESL